MCLILKKNSDAVDVATAMPLSQCSGSIFVETKKITKYNNEVLPYFGFIFLNSATDIISVTVVVNEFGDVMIAEGLESCV
jgi:hypothetical protein